MTIHDTHCHFLSSRFYEALGREKYGAQDGPPSDRIATELGWEAPGPPDRLADRWVAKLGLPNVLDLRFGDPLALAATAVRFPNVPAIVPHFGAGFFREALMAAEACPNVHLDTSSSNSWVKFVPGLTLTEVFRRALAVAGPNRLIFGTDSSYFPR